MLHLKEAPHRLLPKNVDISTPFVPYYGIELHRSHCHLVRPSLNRSNYPEILTLVQQPAFLLIIWV